MWCIYTYICKYIHIYIHIYIHNGILFSHEKEESSSICNNVDEPGWHYNEWNKSDRERQILHSRTYRWNLKIPKLTETRPDCWLPETGVSGAGKVVEGETSVKGYKPPVKRWTSRDPILTRWLYITILYYILASFWKSKS